MHDVKPRLLSSPLHHSYDSVIGPFWNFTGGTVKYSLKRIQSHWKYGQGLFLRKSHHFREGDQKPSVFRLNARVSSRSTLPDGVSFDFSNGYVYVANFNFGTISIIATATNTAEYPLWDISSPIHSQASCCEAIPCRIPTSQCGLFSSGISCALLIVCRKRIRLLSCFF